MISIVIHSSRSSGMPFYEAIEEQPTYFSPKKIKNVRNQI